MKEVYKHLGYFVYGYRGSLNFFHKDIACRIFRRALLFMYWGVTLDVCTPADYLFTPKKRELTKDIFQDGQCGQRLRLTTRDVMPNGYHFGMKQTRHGLRVFNVG